MELMRKIKGLFELVIVGFGGVTAVFVFVLCFVIPMAFALASFESNRMRKLGYESKVVNLECFAKYKDRWLSCGAVISNQVEVVQSE